MKYITSFIACALLAACTLSSYNTKKADYWQRIDTSSALYLQGAKAQQSLERDISRCVTEIEELVSLGAIRKSLPEDASKEKYAFHTNKAYSNAYWNVPQRLGHKYVDHTQYHDFDSCMRFKGWRRVAYNNNQAIDLSLETYHKLKKQRTGGKSYKNSSAYKVQTESGSSYDHLND